MEIELSERIRNLAPSATLAVGRKAKELQAKGIQVLNLSVGEPDFPPAPEARDAVIAAAKTPARYTDSRGVLSLREAVCRRAKEDLGLSYAPDQVVVSCGSKHTLYNLFQSLLDPGDEVVIPVPYWTSYPEMVRLAGGVPVFVRPKDGFKVRPEDLEPAITPKTKLLIINSPNNPSGVVYDRDDLAAIAAWLRKKDLMVISDDAYQYFIYNGRPFCNLAVFPGLTERTLIVGAASKTYAMTGWRCGWFLGPKEVADAVAKLQDQSTSNPSSLAQSAAEAALKGSQASVREMLAAFQRRQKILLEKISAVKKISCAAPDGAFYLFFTHPAIQNSADFASRLLEEKQVALVPGIAFGLEGYLRLSYAVSEDVLTAAAARLVEFLEK